MKKYIEMNAAELNAEYAALSEKYNELIGLRGPTESSFFPKYRG